MAHFGAQDTHHIDTLRLLYPSKLKTFGFTFAPNAPGADLSIDTLRAKQRNAPKSADIYPNYLKEGLTKLFLFKYPKSHFWE